MTFSRLQTSQSRLQILWERAPDESFAGVVTLADAIEFMARRSGGKPVLINRETEQRDAKVAKLYQEALASERFSLASRWFHCVKVGDEVLDEQHPLHQLFAGRNPSALVMLSPDGKKQLSFLGTTQQLVKWTPIASLLEASYKKDPTTAVKGLEKLLCTFDMIDGKQTELNAQLERAQKKPDENKIAAIKQKLADGGQALEQAFAEEEELRKLVLRSESTGG